MPKNPLDLTFPEVDILNLARLNLRGDHVLLRVYPMKEETEGGIVLTDASMKPRMMGWVLATGTEVPDDIQIGHTALCPFSDLRNPVNDLGDGIVCLLHGDLIGTYPPETS